MLLGTGTPVPDPDRSGPATAIVVDDSVYLVDFGPGVVRRAKQLLQDVGAKVFGVVLNNVNLREHDYYYYRSYYSHYYNNETSAEEVA